MVILQGSLLISLKRDKSPGFPKAAKKVVGSCERASEKLTVSPILVTPKGMPARAVTTIPIKIAPLTLRIKRTTVKISPKIARSTAGVLSAASPGTAAELAITVPPSPIADGRVGQVNNDEL